MANHIHIHIRSKVRNAGFSKQEYNPREYNRLMGEIREIEDQLKATKRPFEKQDLERIKARLKQELGKYRTDSAYDQSSTQIKNEYYAWARKNSLDPQSRVTFKKYVRKENLSPGMESELEVSARIGQA